MSKNKIIDKSLNDNNLLVIGIFVITKTICFFLFLIRNLTFFTLYYLARNKSLSLALKMIRLLIHLFK